jgi:hypothetical protein
LKARIRRKLELGVALEIEHGIDDVLEHARPGQRALLGDVADEEQRGAALLGVARELGGAFAHLGDRAGRGLQRVAPQRLDRVDHRDGGLLLAQHVQDAFEVDLGQQLERGGVEVQPARAQRDLLARFLAADVERRRARRQVRQRLQQQRRFADARVAADQHHAAGHQPAAQHAVEFLDAGGRARLLARADLGQHAQLAGAAHVGQGGEARGRRGFGDGLDQRVPGTAAGALPLPLGRAGAAFGTGVEGFLFGHAQSITLTGTRGARAQNSS